MQYISTVQLLIPRNQEQLTEFININVLNEGTKSFCTLLDLVWIFQDWSILDPFLIFHHIFILLSIDNVIYGKWRSGSFNGRRNCWGLYIHSTPKNFLSTFTSSLQFPSLISPLQFSYFNFIQAKNILIIYFNFFICGTTAKFSVEDSHRIFRFCKLEHSVYKHSVVYFVTLFN